MDDKKVIDFPIPELTPEERARRLRVEVERLAGLPEFEWLLYRNEQAEKYGIPPAVLEKMVRATIRANDKKAREDKAENRRSEKKESASRREEERQQRAQQRERERAEKADAKEQERKSKERTKALEAIAKLPRLAHEARLAELAKSLGEDLPILRAEFMALFGPEETDDELEPWPEPVETKALLTAIIAQFRRYVIMSDDVAIGIAVWTMWARVHEIAVHSPLLVITSAEPDGAKTTTLGVVKYLSRRPYTQAEPTGPSLYRLVDQLHPTLIIDDADKLFPRKPDLAHIVNVSWTRGTTIPRTIRGVVYRFDPFCPKALGLVGLDLPRTTVSRALICKLYPPLPGETFEDFRHEDDDDFRTLRRKLMRWAADNAAALQDAKPTMPIGFRNRQAANWRLLLAIADLAGASIAKQAREAAVKLAAKRRQPSEGIRLLAALREMFSKRMLTPWTSDEIEVRLNADKDGEWADFRGHGPISKRQIAVLLDPFDIHPQVIHPTGRADHSPRGYHPAWFEDVFARYLPPLPPPTARVTRNIRTSAHPQRKRRGKSDRRKRGKSDRRKPREK
jgi:hypothetical protein